MGKHAAIISKVKASASARSGKISEKLQAPAYVQQPYVLTMFDVIPPYHKIVIVRQVGFEPFLRLGAELEKAHADVKAAVKSGNDYPDDFVFTDDIVADKMIDVHATTLRGLKTKVRALFIALGLPEDQWNTPERWQYSNINDGLTLSIMEDILAMESFPENNHA